MTALSITDTTPIVLTCSLDASSTLVIHHQSNNLADYEDSILAEKDDLATEPVRFEAHDFIEGTETWTMSASHVVGGQTITWTPETGSHCWHDSGETSSELGVDIVATESSTSQTKLKRIYIEVKPKTSKPDPI